MPKIDDLITDIAKGGLQLPEFQRGYVWTRDQARTFIESLYMGHPTGHLLIWHAYGPVRTKGDGSGPSGKTLLILDGQQRLTTLYALIKGQAPPFYEGETLFLDLWFNVVTEKFSYYNKNQMDADASWYSVHDFLRKGINQFVDDMEKLPDDQRAVAQKGLGRLNNLDRIHSYVYQIDELKDEDLTLDEVVDIFNRVNSKGTPLSRADLAIAHMSIYWPEARSTLLSFTKSMSGHGFSIEPAFLVRATSAVAGGPVNFDAAFYELSTEAFQDAWPKVRATFEYLVNVLSRDAFIDSLADLASPISLVPIIIFLARRGSTFSSDHQRDAFLQWMYLANVWGRYAGTTDTKLGRDVASLAEQNPTERLIEAIVADRGRIQIEAADLVGKGSTSGFYKLAYIVARSRGAKDWFTGQTLYQKAIGKSNGLHSHHIFPRAVLRQAGMTERRIVNQIANRAFLTQRANLKIASQEPAKYLPRVQHAFPAALEQQNIPMHEDLWMRSNYMAFFERRRSLLARSMNGFLSHFGSPGVDALHRVGITSLLGAPESQHLEFKSSLRWDRNKGYTNTVLEDVVVKAIAGFLNADGGNLLIGVDDSGSVLGLEDDYLSSKSIEDRDGFERHVINKLSSALGAATMTFVLPTFHKVDGHDVCQVSVKAADHPVYVETAGVHAFYVRQGNATKSLDLKDTMTYVLAHWK